MNQDNTNKLFVGNLDWNLTNQELQATFSKIGKVLDAFVVKDKETKKSRGFGFVIMGSNEECDRAIESLNQSELNGRKMNVSKAVTSVKN